MLFYTDDELEDIGILEKITEDNITTTYIHVYKLKPHQGLLNIYGDNTYIKYSEDDTDPQQIEQGFVIISNATIELSPPLESVPLLAEDQEEPGEPMITLPIADVNSYELVCADINEHLDLTEYLKDPRNYLIHSLGSSGTYYVPLGWAPTSTWTYTTNATDLYGTSIYLTFSPNKTRWFHKNSVTYNTISYHMYNATALSDHTLVKNSIDSYDITSTQNSIWGIQYLLGDELVTEGQTAPGYNGLEEVICDEIVNTYTQINDAHQMCNYYGITTDIPGNSCNLYINYY